MPVLDPGRGRTKTGQLWAYVRDERAWAGPAPPSSFYRYSPDRKGERPAGHLRSFSGILHADGYVGYDRLYGERTGIAEMACMAHVRRKFFDIAESTGSPVAKEALERIAQLYAVEKQARGLPPSERLALRQREAAPVWDDLRAWMGTTLPQLPGRSGLAAAMRYAITRTKRMTPYLTDGRSELDNDPTRAFGHRSRTMPPLRLIPAP